MHLTCQMKILINIYWNYYLNLRKEECFLFIKYILKSTSYSVYMFVVFFTIQIFEQPVQSVRSVINTIETSKHFNSLTHNELVSKYVLGLKDQFSDHVCLKTFTVYFILIVKSDIYNVSDLVFELKQFRIMTRFKIMHS